MEGDGRRGEGRREGRGCTEMEFRGRGGAEEEEEEEGRGGEEDRL